MIRAYKYRIYPNQEQEILIAKHLGCSRWVYNYALGKKNKADWYACNILRIGQFEPSSKMCSCGVINQELTLKDREWTCSSCGKQHDRDILAANNIKKFAFVKQNTVGTTEIHALRNMTKVTRSAQETA